jgi:hypothetical protein
MKMCPVVFGEQFSVTIKAVMNFWMWSMLANLTIYRSALAIRQFSYGLNGKIGF